MSTSPDSSVLRLPHNSWDSSPPTKLSNSELTRLQKKRADEERIPFNWVKKMIFNCYVGWYSKLVFDKKYYHYLSDHYNIITPYKYNQFFFIYLNKNCLIRALRAPRLLSRPSPIRLLGPCHRWNRPPWSRYSYIKLSINFNWQTSRMFVSGTLPRPSAVRSIRRGRHLRRWNPGVKMNNKN